VYTGYGKSAGTTAEVSFILSGDEGESEPRLLRDSKRKTFQRRGVDVFLATFPESFGELNYLHIWHNNAGEHILFTVEKLKGVEDVACDVVAVWPVNIGSWAGWVVGGWLSHTE